MSKKKIVLIAVIFVVIVITAIFITVKIQNKRVLNKSNETVHDTTAPIIVLDDSYTVKTGYNKNLVDVIMSADDVDKNPKRKIIGDYDLNTAGGCLRKCNY